MDEVVAEEVIELTLPPVAELMALVRFTAATLGARAQFSLDEIEDLRLASGELCLSLMSGLGRGEMRPLRVQLTRRGDTVEISCAVDLGADGALNDSPEREWSLRILDALVDAHGRQVDGLAARGWLKKRRARARGSIEMTSEVRSSRSAHERFVIFAASRDPALRDELVTENLGLARVLARKFTDRGEPYDDLLQVASMALIKSVDRFDPDRGFEFVTFATKTIMGELKRHFRDRGWAVRAPRRLQELYLELGQTINTLSQELGRSPTVAELAVRMGVTEESVLETIEAGQGYRASSIDAPGDEQEPLSARLGSKDATLDAIADRTVLAEALSTLPAREQLIVRLRFFDGLTQSEIARAVGLSQMHVSRLLSSSLERLRCTFAEEK